MFVDESDAAEHARDVAGLVPARRPVVGACGGLPAAAARRYGTPQQPVPLLIKAQQHMAHMSIHPAMPCCTIGPLFVASLRQLFSL